MKKKMSAAQRYQYEGIRGAIPLPEGWNTREYINADDIAKRALGFYESLGDAKIFDAIHERQTQKSDDKMIYRTNIGNAIGKAKESKQLKAEEDELPPEIDVPDGDE